MKILVRGSCGALDDSLGSVQYHQPWQISAASCLHCEMWWKKAWGCMQAYILKVQPACMHPCKWCSVEIAASEVHRTRERCDIVSFATTICQSCNWTDDLLQLTSFCATLTNKPFRLLKRQKTRALISVLVASIGRERRLDYRLRSS